MAIRIILSWETIHSMRINLIFVLLLFAFGSITAQTSFDDYKKSMDEMFDSFVEEQNREFECFTAQQNAEFAAFVEQQWQLFDDFFKSSSPFSEPKLQEAPIASKINSGWSLDLDKVIDFVVKSVPVKNGQSASKSVGTENIVVDFYGEKLSFDVNNNLRIHLAGISERNVADYLRSVSKNSTDALNLWKDIERKSVDFGLNEWGRYLLVKAVAEKLFVSTDDRVMFCFYLLRNMGGYKAKVGRSSEANKLVLLLAIDNAKEVYNYGFFSFNENGQDVKYYLVYGNDAGSVYTYSLNQQDLNLSQIKLDFDAPLSIGNCDKTRELKINALNSTIDLPFNSKNIAFLDDVPQTVFPIYFVSAMPQESQNMLNEKFGELKTRYSTRRAVEVILNFVQTAFDYKTDDDQFGREKYFYPEEVIAYPYCDCEDRSALFGWLVRNYLNLPVIGLLYPGHIATAVCLGEDIKIEGATTFSYGGKKYYLCDPTYIGARIGDEMPNFKNVTPKVIKLKNL